jgi:multidrug efflux pump subunit AcrA (membrane-fusion protein)
LVPNGNGMLQPGLFATARVELPATQPSVLVPASAVRTEAGVSRLFVVRDSRAEQRIVQIGREVDRLVEILSGVSTGERVVAQATDRLADGAPVTESKQEAK